MNVVVRILKKTIVHCIIFATLKIFGIAQQTLISQVRAKKTTDFKRHAVGENARDVGLIENPVNSTLADHFAVWLRAKMPIERRSALQKSRCQARIY